MTFMTWPSSLFALALVGLVLSCAPTGARGEAPRGEVEITLSRSVCYGFCPDYTVTVTGEGEVRYVGRAFVNVVGEARASVPRAEVAALLARFDAIGFERLRDEYRAEVTDNPTYVVTLTRNGRSKRVEDYVGIAVGMPESVRELQTEIDRVAGTARWVLRDGEPVRERPQR
jgi:Domain of unknown function (DUF6438)